METRPLPLLVAAALLCAGCLGPLADADADAPDVVVTHYPIHFLASQIAGDNVTVEPLVDGLQAHNYDPSVQDRLRVEQAPLVIYQGAQFDPWLEQMAHDRDEATTLELASTVQLIDHRDEHDPEREDPDDEHAHASGDLDPHTWTDPVNMIHHAHAVHDALAQTFPQHADAFDHRTQRLTEDLDTLHTAYQTTLATCEIRTLVVNHNAFAYLGERYNLTIESAHGLSPDAEPSARTLDRLIDLVQDNNISTVFHEDFLPPDVIEIIADETGAQTETLSPLGALPPDAGPDEDYITLMGTNLDQLANAMRCDPPR